jgi:ABC-2 type transport system ATP-binding protein
MQDRRVKKMAASNDEVLRFDNVSKRFGETVALDRLSMTLQPGEVVGLLGPNGAGKTTALRILLGLIKPTEGRATVYGFDTWSDPVQVHQRLAYVPSEFNVWPNLTGGQILDLLGAVYGGYDPEIRKQYTERFNFDPGKKGRTYSKGNRQKIGLIAALMTRADLLVMDEPTSGLDPLLEQEFQHVLREAKGRGQTILLSSHVLSEVEVACDRVAILRSGRLVEYGTLHELRHLSARTVEATYRGDRPDLGNVPGIEDIVVENGFLRLQMTGSTDPLIKALAQSEITSINVREPTLEELFHSYYGEGSTND